jgi:hypothetical protein
MLGDDDTGWVADRLVAVARWQRRRRREMGDATMQVGMWTCLLTIALIAFMGGRL